MDAAKKLFTKTALFLATALLIAAPGRAQQLIVSSNQVTLTSNQAVSIQVTSSGANIPFSIINVPSWLSVTSGGNTASSFPINVTFQLVSTICGGPCSTTISLHPTNGTSSDVPIGVTFNSSGGSGGTITPSLTSVTLSTSANPVAVTLSTTNTTPIPFFITVSPQNSWLSANVSNGSVSSSSSSTLTISTNTFAFTNNQLGSITVTPSVGTAFTISVTLNVGSSGVGTSYSVNTNNFTLTYPPATAGAVTVSSALVSTFNAVAASTGNWLLINNSSSIIGQASNTAFSVTLNPNTITTLGTGTYHGTITVSNPNNSNDFVQVNVTLQVNGGSSSSYVPNVTAFTLTYPPSTAGAVTVNSNNASVTTYNATTTSLNNWLLINNQTSLTNQPVNTQISVSLNPNTITTLAQNTYTGTITFTNPLNAGDSAQVTVTLVVSGGSTGVTLTANPSNVSFSYPNGSQNNTNVSVTSNNTSVTQFRATSDANWLWVNGTTTTGFLPVTPSNIIALSVNSAAAALSQGSYTGHITLSNSVTSDTTVITVNLAVGTTGTVSPTSLQFSGVVNSTLPAAQSLTISVASNASFTVNLNNVTGGTNWLSVSAPNTGCVISSVLGSCTLFGSQTLTVNANQSGLAANTYSGSIVITNNGIQTVVPVSLTVTSTGGGTTSTVAAPTSLAFAYQAGTNALNVPQQNVLIAGTGNFTASTSITSGSTQWLSLSASTGSLPATIAVIVSPSGLAAGFTYQGTVTINTSSGTQNIAVSLQVTSGVVIEASPASITFGYTVGSSTASQSFITLFASDGSAQAVSVTSSASWITVTAPTSVTTPTSFTYTANPVSLCNGLNTGTITVSAAGAQNNGFTIPVTALVSGSSSTCSGSSGPLTLSTSSLTFNAAQNGSVPGTQSLTVTTPTTSTSFSISTSVQGGLNWLTVSLPCNFCTLTGSQTLVVSVNQAGLALGTYSGSIILVSNGVTQTVPVSLVVSTTGSGTLTVSPTSFAFSYQIGGTTPAGQALSVTSASGSSGVQYTYTVSSNGNWLSASVGSIVIPNGQSLTTPNNITVNVNPSGLSASTTAYSGTITLTPSGGSAINIPVTLTVQAGAVVTATPTTLSFTYTAGSTPPSGQTVTVSGGSGLTFSATASSTGNWLSVTPAAGTTPGTVTVSVSPSALSANTYTGSVTIAGTGTATGSTTITVTLTVTAPLPTINSVSSAASYAGNTVSPGEVITIFGTSIGPTPTVSLALDPTTGKVATTIGQVQVLVNGNPAPMVFASGTQVSAVVPYEVAGFLNANVQVKFLGQASNVISVPVAATAPGIFTQNASGSGPGAILNANNSVNSPSNPAAKGETVAIFMTGEGQTSPAGVTGRVTGATLTPPQVTPAPLLHVAALVDGAPAAIAYAGEAPSLVSGVMQVNVVIPTTARSGDLSLVISVGSNNSQNGVTVSVK